MKSDRPVGLTYGSALITNWRMLAATGVRNHTTLNLNNQSYIHRSQLY